MFTIFSRKKTITLECFTSNELVYTLTPIVKSTQNFPDWFKKVEDSKIDKDEKGFLVHKPTIKRCYGFLELYKKSITMESWADFKYEVTPNDGYKYLLTLQNVNPVEHHQWQRGEGFKNYYHTKLTSPWHFREKTGVYFMMSPHVWNLEDYYFTIPSAIINFNLQHATNINIFIPKPKKEAYEFLIPNGHPIVHFTPLIHDVKVKIKNYLVDDSELGKLAKHPRLSYVRGFNSLLDLQKRNEKRNIKKCPFNFGDKL